MECVIYHESWLVVFRLSFTWCRFQFCFHSLFSLAVIVWEFAYAIYIPKKAHEFICSFRSERAVLCMLSALISVSTIRRYEQWPMPKLYLHFRYLYFSSFSWHKKIWYYRFSCSNCLDNMYNVLCTLYTLLLILFIFYCSYFLRSPFVSLSRTLYVDRLACA